MFKLFTKIFSTPKTVIDEKQFFCDKEILEMGKKIEEKVKKLFTAGR